MVHCTHVQERDNERIVLHGFWNTVFADWAGSVLRECEVDVDVVYVFPIAVRIVADVECSTEFGNEERGGIVERRLDGYL